MPTAPRINYPDLSGTTNVLVLTTNMYFFSFTGEVDSNVIDIQININSSGWVSNPSLIELTLPSFAVPSRNVLPDGIELDQGINIIQVRSVDISGAIGPISTVTVTVISSSQFELVQPSPTGIRLQRNAKSVYLQWSDVLPTDVTGFNVYASTGKGGTKSGYLRVNKELLSSVSQTKPIEELIDISNYTFDVENPGTITSPTQTVQIQNVVLTDLVIQSDLKDATLDSYISTPNIHRFTLSSDPKYRVTYSIQALRNINFFSFQHDRNDSVGNGILNSDTFSIISSEDPLFYVVTAVYFDKTTGQMQESKYSLEMSGSPLVLDTTIRGIR
ncbi:MAG TPA: hypothetical protein ENI76_08605, partial [Ignavibacteria bacterium]|nr:hypothetical protein [Ignavibacteria bacterium]